MLSKLLIKVIDGNKEISLNLKIDEIKKISNYINKITNLRQNYKYYNSAFSDNEYLRIEKIIYLYIVR